MTWTAQEIGALRAGEALAVDRLYRDHARQVLGWVIRLGGPWLDAEDIAHDVFIVALRRVSAFRGESSMSSWLFGITRNVVANARRRAALRRFFGLEEIPELPEPGDAPDAEVERLRHRRQVQLALERLSGDHREVLVLVDLEGRSAPEASNVLGIAAGTVYSRLHHARRRFAEALHAEGLPTGPDIAVASMSAGDR
jgi:RNA polymerase sigma-70 factor (ECF subfamily)